MKSKANVYVRMLGFIKPHLNLLILSSLLSMVIVMLDGVSLWFLGTLPKTLLNMETAVQAKPVLSIGTLNEYLKYWTWAAIQSRKSQNPLMSICILIAVTFTFKNIIVYVHLLIVRYLNLRIVCDIRNILYRHVLRLPLTYYDKNKSGAIVARIYNDAAQIKNSLSGTLSKLFMEPFRLLFFIVLLLIINVKLTLLVFLIYPVLALIIVKIGLSVKRRSRRWLNKFSDLLAILSETIQGIRAVKMFNMNEMENRKFERQNQLFLKSHFRSDQMKGLLSPLTEVLAVYVTSLLLWYGGRQVLSDHSTFEATDFFRFLFILFSSYQPLKILGSINNTVQGGVAAAERIFELLDTPEEDLAHHQIKGPPVFKERIHFNSVEFTYPQTENQVLKRVSFTVEKEQTVAIVGSSGAGKSTILDLLPRFYEIQRGQILIDEKDIHDFNLVALRKLFGIVSQETILFNDTVRNNIAYGTEHMSEEKIREAAQTANALQFIEKLPEGMDTVIGERGISLSGGQRQRLAIARALLQNPPILILDEATSSLDTESERHVQQAINILMKNRTTLVVAHRLSTIHHADKIIVLENGVVVEQGTHEELLAQNNRYKYLYDIQFAGTSQS